MQQATALSGMPVFQPTVFGSSSVESSVVPIAQHQQSTQVQFEPSSTIGGLMNTQARTNVEALASKTDVSKMSLRDVSMIGQEADIGLNRSLSGFMDQINKADSPRLFNLVASFNEQVAKEDIPKLAHKVLNEKLPLIDRIRGFFNPNSLVKSKNNLAENVRSVVAAKSVTLTSVINKMETDLATEQQRLENELKVMERLRSIYFQQFMVFVERTYFAQCLLQSAKAIDTSSWDEHQKRTFSEKLVALESRALAMESTMTRLPADALVVSQLQNAGVLTLQETTTTAAGRFASIKMTLITLHSALITRSVQYLSEQSAALDNNLLDVRSQLMKQVVGTAAAMPGKNRQQQAQQLLQIVSDVKELMEIVDQAKATNIQQFDAARKVFGEARIEIAQLGGRTTILNLDS